MDVACRGGRFNECSLIASLWKSFDMDGIPGMGVVLRSVRASAKLLLRIVELKLESITAKRLQEFKLKFSSNVDSARASL